MITKVRSQVRGKSDIVRAHVEGGFYQRGRSFIPGNEVLKDDIAT